MRDKPSRGTWGGGIVVDANLTELDENLNGALTEEQKASLRASILNKAEGKGDRRTSNLTANTY